MISSNDSTVVSVSLPPELLNRCDQLLQDEHVAEDSRVYAPSETPLSRLIVKAVETLLDSRAAQVGLDEEMYIRMEEQEALYEERAREKMDEIAMDIARSEADFVHGRAPVESILRGGAPCRE